VVTGAYQRRIDERTTFSRLFFTSSRLSVASQVLPDAWRARDLNTFK
jgi:hypothetical protein